MTDLNQGPDRSAPSSTHVGAPRASAQGGPPPLPGGLAKNLTGFRSAMRRSKLTEKAAIVAAVLLVSFLCVAVLDRFVETHSVARAALFFASLGFAAYAVPKALQRWYFRHSDLREVAREVTLKDDAVGDRLLGVFELTSDEEEYRRSPELVRAAIAQGERDFGSHDLSYALPTSRPARALGLLAVPAAAALGFAAMYPAVAGNAFKRWALPFSDTERYTFARLDGLASDWIVPIEEEDTIELALSDATESRPEVATLSVAGQTLRATLDGDRYRLALPPFGEDRSGLLVVGDLRETITVQPRPRPEIVAAGATVTLPAYLEIDEPRSLDGRGGSVVVVEGSSVALELEASRNIESVSATVTPRPALHAEADVDAAVTDAQPDEARTPTAQQWNATTDGAVVRFDPLDCSARGTLAAGGTLNASWVDEIGLAGHAAYKLGLRTRVDEPPVVSLSGIDREVVALETKAMTFDVLSGDDFGVRQVGLEWRSIGYRGRVSDEVLGWKVLDAGAPTDDRLQSLATFKPEDLGVEPGLIELRAWAIDALPGRERAYSTPVKVRVMTASEHMEWVTANLERWLRRATEVRDREMQLLATNKELHALANAELATPEARAKIENQARAERSNRARLQSLVGQGQELLAEAARNEEFGSNSLDDWAEANAKLKEIADKRMDSVAKLLADAARASETPPGEAGDPGSPKNPSQGGKPSKGQGSPSSSGEPSESNPKVASADQPPSESSPSDDKKTPKMIGENRGSAPSQGQKAPEEEERPEDAIPPTPTIMDGESNIAQDAGEQPEPKEGEAGAKPPPASLGLVETTLGPVAQDGDEDEEEDSGQAEPPETPSMTKEELAKAIEEQEKLLADFNEVAGDIEQTLVNLQNSTFVKRLKAASRVQISSARELDTSVASGFGSVVAASVDDDVAKASKVVATTSEEELPKLANLHGDLGAYVDRLESRSSEDVTKFKRVLDEWNDVRPTILADTLVEEAEGGRPGDARASADFLGDTFDRWGEELVGPG